MREGNLKAQKVCKTEQSQRQTGQNYNQEESYRENRCDSTTSNDACFSQQTPKNYDSDSQDASVDDKNQLSYCIETKKQCIVQSEKFSDSNL